MVGKRNKKNLLIKKNERSAKISLPRVFSTAAAPLNWFTLLNQRFQLQKAEERNFSEFLGPTHPFWLPYRTERKSE